MTDVTQGTSGRASDPRVSWESATVRVTRNPARFRDRLRSYRVFIDGRLVGTIRDGQTADFRVPAGHHDINVKLDWTGSRVVPLDVGLGEVAQVACEPAGSALAASLDVFTALGKNGKPWIELHRVSDDANAPAREAVPTVPPPYVQYQPPPPASTNPFAVASLVLGIVWLAGLGSILALVFARVARKQIDRSSGNQTGRGLAIAGKVLGWVGIAALVPFIVGAVVTSNNRTTQATTTTTTVLNRKVAAQSYLASITPLNRAVAAFALEAARWNNQTTDAQAAQQAQPVIAALHDLEQRLLRTPWPRSARPDAKTLASSVTSLIKDLQGLADLKPSDASNWKATFRHDAALVKAADDLLRHDLGLPPSSSSAASPGSNPSHPTSPGTNPPGGNQNGGGTGSNNGGGTCFGCVTITTVTWAFYPAPDVPSVYHNCIAASSAVRSNLQVIGPHVTNPAREFTYTVHYTNACPSNGIELNVGKVELRGANPPISIISTNPPIPFALTPHTTQTLEATFHALEGNYYNGPLQIDVVID